MPARNYANAPATTLASACTAIDTTLTVTSVVGLPSVPYTIILGRGTSSEEVVQVNSASGVNLTVARGQDGTTAWPHTAGSSVAHGISARDHREANQHINSSTGVHGVTGDIVGTTQTQTLTNKTLTTPTINTPNVTGGAFASPAFNTPTITVPTIKSSTVGGAVAAFKNTTGDTVAAVYDQGRITALDYVQVSRELDEAGGYYLRLCDDDGTLLGYINSSLLARFSKLYLDDDGTLTLGSGIAAGLTIGNPAGTNLAFDGQHVQSRNNGAAQTLGVNTLGGDVNIGAGSSDVSINSNDTFIGPQDSTASTINLGGVNTNVVITNNAFHISSGKLFTVSTVAPSGGSDGDVWIRAAGTSSTGGCYIKDGGSWIKT